MLKEKRVLSLPRRVQSTSKPLVARALSSESEESSSASLPPVAFQSSMAGKTLPRAERGSRITINYLDSEGKSVSVSDAVPPSLSFLLSHQTLLSSLVEHLSNPSRRWKASLKETCLIRRDMQLSEMINRVQRYVHGMYQIKLTESNMSRIQQHLDDEQLKMLSETGELPLNSPVEQPSDTSVEEQSVQVAIERSLEDAVLKSYTAQSPGRYPAEQYNQARGHFLTHTLHDMKGENPAAEDYIDKYYAIVPVNIKGQWQTSRDVGMLLYVPNERLDLQTVFLTEMTTSQLTLKADDVAVARYDLFDVTQLAPEHKQLVQAGRRGESAYNHLSARAMVIFVTPAAISWMMENDCTDSMLNGQHIRPCVGFDPFYTRLTYHGVVEAAILLDDKYTPLSKQRMVKRVLDYAPGNPARDIFLRFYRLNWRSFADQYSPVVTGAQQNWGLSQLVWKEDHDTLQAQVESLRDQNSSLVVQLAETSERCRPVPAPRKCNLKPKIDGSNQLNVYLDEHKCINATKNEHNLLTALNVEPSKVVHLFDVRKRVHAEVTEKYRVMGTHEAYENIRNDTTVTDQLNAQLRELADRCRALEEAIIQSDLDRQRLENDLDATERENIKLQHALAVSAKKLHQISHATQRAETEGERFETPHLIVDPLPPPTMNLNELADDL
ncbi:mu NS [Mahlapitsi orthoreovirus]|uniref:Mu NS n=1 Tax=Mahlapitsi orthoreovirus TaxID=2170064 RepID=A0A3G1DHL1_9REOV|nr:mu NS [Mahlapitsi orthoreovirus]AMU04176.1 mu NS [Mahlapitsi orthoreovirus]